MTTEINSLLKLYLGAEENGGYQPIGCEERIKNAFPGDYVGKMRQISQYLDEDHTPDWTKNDLIAESHLFEGELRTKYPELDSIVIRALANRWPFGWK